ncbi:MAG TPA: TonB-dependent receptor [Candidatus Sulfotelmatobacter sp.]|nr:TonB-dependent receptor [Candidatus Sulfotelmatobacter sp.]
MIARSRLNLIWVVASLGLALSADSVRAQNDAAPPAAAQSTSTSGTISGLVKAGNMPIPGATVTITGSTDSQPITTWTDVQGRYSARVPAAGTYTVRVEMMAFAKRTQQVTVDAVHQSVPANFELILLSRSLETPSQPKRAPGQVGGQRGFQNLSILQSMAQDSGNNSMSDVVPSGMPVPGIDPNSATESVAVSGNPSSTNNGLSFDDLQQRIGDARQMGGGFGAPGAFGGPGGGFGGPGGFGGGGGGRGMIIGRRGFDINHPHGSIYYGIGDSVLNASPYALAGEPATNPSYLQNSFGGSVGGPLNIPKIYHGGTKTFFFVNYNGRRGENPFDQFSTVPTLLERQGNFSQTQVQGQPVTITDPATGLPFANDTLPQVNPIAQGLLQYIPLPNLPGSLQNFHFVTSAKNSSDDLNVRVNHTLGAAPTTPRRSGGAGGGGGRGGGGRGAPRNSLTFGFHYHGANSSITNPFPSVGGSTAIRSFDVPLGYIRSIGKLTNSLRFDFNRSRTRTQNLYAFNSDIDNTVGITGVSTNPFDWGLPNLSFKDFTGLQDVTPQLLRNQTFTFSDSVVYTHGKHTFRWGGDFRRIQLNTETSGNARGTFVFTGINTGFDFADFLYDGTLNGQTALGLPQQTSVQYGDDNYHFRGNYWDAYVQDEWKLRSNVTLNLGVRYEYVSPLSEVDKRIANLDLSPGVLTQQAGLTASAVAVVLPGQTGPFSGGLPNSLVRPDRNNIAPRIGFAWKPFSKTVVRGGYGINYNTGAYQGIAQQLAFQPPFSTAATNIQSVAGDITLQNGFPTLAANGITNNYAVNPDYRLGYVQIRNLDIQQQIRPTILLNIDYTGTKGTALDVLEAPNRTSTGILIPNVQAFTYENSVGDSEANAGTVRLRKRLAHGFSIGGTYTFSKSIDDASSIGAGATSSASRAGLGGGGTGPGGGGPAASVGTGTSNVAQDPNQAHLSEERGLSSFNQTHRFTADYLLELPFGQDKRWLSGVSPMRAIFGDWQWSGDWTVTSGLPFTPRDLGSITDVARGTNGTLRPDLVPGQTVSLGNPSIAEWFNTAAFVAPPIGTYGDARRNSIIGPGSLIFDMAFTKVIPLKESRVLEFRAQASNIFNHPNYSAIDTSLTSPTFGRVTGVGGMRQITLTARFRF